MSLIQEALRRQHEEGDGGDVSPASQPVSPSKPAGRLSLKHAAPVDDSTLSDFSPPPPDDQNEGPGSDPSGGHDKKRLALLAVGLLIVLGAAGAGAWFYLVKGADSSDVPAASPPPVVADTSTPTSQIMNPAPVETSVETTTVEPATEVVNAVVASDEEATVELTEGETVESISSWPSLTVSGTAGRGARSSAFINKQLVLVGDLVDGVKVLSIDIDSVDLEFNGEKQTVLVGKTTR